MTTSQVGIENEMYRLMAKGEEALHDLVRCGQLAAESESHYRAEYAKAILQASGSVAVKEATATVACSGLLRDRLMAANRFKTTQAEVRYYETQLRILQTMASNQRALVTGSA